jgi:hypothetical protein
MPDLARGFPKGSAWVRHRRVLYPFLGDPSTWVASSQAETNLGISAGGAAQRAGTNRAVRQLSGELQGASLADPDAARRDLDRDISAAAGYRRRSRQRAAASRETRRFPA